MQTQQMIKNNIIYRKDYTAPAFWIDTVDLSFDLDPIKTRVLNKMKIRRNADLPQQALRLDGEDLNLARVLVNGEATSFKIDNGQLVLENLPEGFESFELEIFTTCSPIKNTAFTGLYVSQDSFFTQCEAQGFRRITYFLDRPDVMASYSVTLRADKTLYPVLLSNGNLIEQGDLSDGRHFAHWQDPHKKPCYLFALVAGQFVAREQRIKARNGREHLLQVYVRLGDLDKTEHAMNSLISSIIWDEVRFDLPLDLDRFMIVATSDFNMGAMENKGLNIFNTKFVLANQNTATDSDYANIESVVGHEYFHNWTGNRVTCRDWFQLSLKEGLTVFRDQEFSQDLAGSDSARAVKRIEDVRLLRTAQFPEDSGPMAHPVRPECYQEINNFYTMTVYEKGAEVVRMMQTLVGRDGFKAGMKLYFERFDGQAVTCDDFAQSIADANPQSDLARYLEPFKRWYSQAGTPLIHATGVYNPENQTYQLTLTQNCEQKTVLNHSSEDSNYNQLENTSKTNYSPFVIPVNIGLLSQNGESLPLFCDEIDTKDNHQNSDPLDKKTNEIYNRTFVLHENSLSICFKNIQSEPVPSILRGFSAPVILIGCDSEKELLTRLAFDSDPFNRWEAGQRLALKAAVDAINEISLKHQTHLENNTEDNQTENKIKVSTHILNDSYIAAMRSILNDDKLDSAFKELILTLPSETYLSEQLSNPIHPQYIYEVRESMRLQLATALFEDWKVIFHQLQFIQNHQSYSPDAKSSGYRALMGLALSQLCLVENQRQHYPYRQNFHFSYLAFKLFKYANNMTNRLNALNALIHSGHDLAKEALQQFYNQFKNEPLVIDKWFALQASAPDLNHDVFAQVQELTQHPDFTLKNPNRARSLIFTFCSANPSAFHRLDGFGYTFWADHVLALDAINPQVAARLARAMDRFSRLSEPYRAKALAAIQHVAAHENLSRDVREVIQKALSNNQ